MDNRIFVIETQNTHYVIGVDNDGIVRNLHWGKKASVDCYQVLPYGAPNSNHSARDIMNEEYTAFGGTCYRNCAFKCVYHDGTRDAVLRFHNANQSKGVLDIVLVDKEYDLYATLSYRYSEDNDVITRYTTFENKGAGDIAIEKMMSAEIGFDSDNYYDITNTNGAWGAEFRLETTTLKNGTITYESRKGTAGHTNQPFVIVSQNANEDFGDVYFAALGYGGSFKVEVQRDFAGKTRAMLGISDFDFCYTLKVGDSLETPPVYMGYTQGFASMSNMMNKFAVDNILPQRYAKEPLPVLYNSWEATEFDVNCEHQLALAKLASQIGCELFVMDDGWFGKRNNDRAGLGDWFVNLEKFPQGLKPLIDGVNALGMKFGLWFEPEMVQKDSDLFRAHPDWTYHYPNRYANELRHQLVLNLTKPEVKQYVFDCMDKMLCQYNIEYIKWDMNRPFSEIGTDNLENGKELWYRHTMAVYDIADMLRQKHPNLQIEACSSGGGRAEYGAMKHFDMVWTSDNTDPIARLDIQRGFSMIYPIKCMRAWVTDTNKHVRGTALDLRFNVSMQGSLSIGSNLLKYTDEELEKCKQYIELYKDIRPVVQFGNLYRLKNHHDDGLYVNQYVSDDKKRSVVFIVAKGDFMVNDFFKTVKLKGLDKNAMYKVKSGNNEFVKSGSYLMNVASDFIGWQAPFNSSIWLIEQV